MLIFTRVFILVFILLIGAAWIFLVPNRGVSRVVVTVIIFGMAIGYCLFMESRNTAYSFDCVSTDKENILKELPSLELTEDEVAFYCGIFEEPLIVEYLKVGKEDIPVDDIQAVLEGILPEEAVVEYALIYDVDELSDGSEVPVRFILDYDIDGLNICIECSDDEDRSITKVISKNSGRKLYENANNEHYRKYIRKRKWFDWIINY